MLTFDGIVTPTLRRVVKRTPEGATAQQIVDAFPGDSAPSYLLCDRDNVYGQAFRQRVKRMRIEEVLTAPQSPLQNPFAERLIGVLASGSISRTTASARSPPVGFSRRGES